MTEFFHEEKTGEVSPAEYEASKLWKATLEEMKSALRDASEESDEDDRRPSRFTLRLLDQGSAGATDRFVELVTIDDFEDIGSLVSVRESRKEGRARLESHYVRPDGLVFEGTSGLERGYFLGGPGVGAEDIKEHENYAKLVPQKKEVLKVMALPLPDLEPDEPYDGTYISYK